MLSTLPDPRNANILVWVNGLVPRSLAAVSVFDSTVQVPPCLAPHVSYQPLKGGDAVWEGVRVYKGRVFHLSQHIERMINSAKAMAFTDIPSPATIRVLDS
jgi:branched-subunit amino acid aminotransferase/4-amino-4-deoxychorismate lyase